jgi:uncharacterized lipoprotein YajG
MTARLVLVLGAALAASDVHAQATLVVSVSARILASCTTTIEHPQSTCPQQTVLQQSNITGASAKISASGNDVGVTQKGGPSPKIEVKGNQATVTF